MTLNILFLTIKINRRKHTAEKAVQQERIKKLYEEYKDKQIPMYHF